MANAIYAGSFNPFTFGHRYVVEQAAEIFDEIHIIVANNPDKKNQLDADLRCKIIASALQPRVNWLEKYLFNLGFKVSQDVISDKTNIYIIPYSGLIAEYAEENKITHLIRGLRSTSDYESEFNLYFANRAINSKLQTWCLMCPPYLLHCSSSYARAIAGKNTESRPTTYLAECALLNMPLVIGAMADYLTYCKIPVDSIFNQLRTLWLAGSRFANQEKITRQFMDMFQEGIFLDNFLPETSDNFVKVNALLHSFMECYSIP